MYRARLHRYLWKYLKRQPASEKAVYLRYVTRKTIPNPRPRQMGILCHAPLRLSIYLFRSNAGIFLLKSFVAMNNGTCPTVRDRTATCKICFPRDRQIITFQSPPRSRQDLPRDTCTLSSSLYIRNLPSLAQLVIYLYLNAWAVLKVRIFVIIICTIYFVIMN